MPTLDDVYRKFGEVSEAAQLLETELGTRLLMNGCIDKDLLNNSNQEKAAQLYRQIERSTLGQLLKQLNRASDPDPQLEALLSEALTTRNRLAHSFYLRHNFRRNSEDGRAIMIKDLEAMHEKLLKAYKAVMLLSGIDLDELAAEQGSAPQPAIHVPI